MCCRQSWHPFASAAKCGSSAFPRFMKSCARAAGLQKQLQPRRCMTCAKQCVSTTSMTKRSCTSPTKSKTKKIPESAKGPYTYQIYGSFFVIKIMTSLLFFLHLVFLIVLLQSEDIFYYYLYQ